MAPPDIRQTLHRLVRRGPRDVVLTYPSHRGGNHLYSWLLADRLRADNPQTFTLWMPNQEAWLEEFPDLRALSVPRLRLTDRRLPWPGHRFGIDFSRDDLHRFCHERLLSSESFGRRAERACQELGEDALTINVRRGDYYGTSNEREWGMRIRPFVEEAIARHQKQEPVTRVQFVSDDLAWCERELAAALPPLGISSASFTRIGDSMFDDLATLAASRRLILANSTFSYWGAYLASVRGTDPARIVAPGFHQKEFGTRLPWFDDPQWTIVRDLPGGWQTRPEPAGGAEEGSAR
ncbi:alpha-1,2-fucosyltransferase [Actinomyces sp. MRS3W]|uniref:alpha-1,2-fucosyltransferase n=1 Tax=Actinomyces sp. MRS3W TaxID=2800796 RepID=UPI0028FD775E|nr:alpha-1,2-fucosyltransferase [Actinomyces sp. MRS3W]MDU0348251.1 alpha-1,2-fucosyltransferase [Actinomyces sp. MRS3W]